MSEDFFAGQPKPEELNLEGEINQLRYDPSVHTEELFGSNKMQDGQYPERPDANVNFDSLADISTAHNR